MADTNRNTSIRRQQLKPIRQSDLDATNAVVDGYIPSYDLATGQFNWIAPGASVLNGLTDVDFDSGTPADNNVLTYDSGSGKWKSESPVSGGVTLDGAYDFGGAGAGRTINVTNGAVVLAGTETTNHILEVTNSSNTTGSLIYAYSNSADTGFRNLVSIVNDNPAATGASPLAIQQDSTEPTLKLAINGVIEGGKGAIDIRTNAVQVSALGLIYLVQENASSTSPCVYFNNYGTGTNLYVVQQTTLKVNASALKVFSTAAHTNAGSAVVSFHNGNSGTTVPVLKVYGQGTGILALLESQGIGETGLKIYKVGASATGKSLELVTGNNSANNTIGIDFQLTNIGGGSRYAMTFNGTEYTSSAVGGTQNRKIHIQIGGTDYFIPAYTA